MRNDDDNLFVVFACDLLCKELLTYDEYRGVSEPSKIYLGSLG